MKEGTRELRERIAKLARVARVAFRRSSPCFVARIPMDEDRRKILESLGWSKELLDMLKRTPEHEAVDKMFRDRAENAFSAAGCTALEFLAENPAVSMVELAKKLNRGASAIGIVMVIYREAVSRGVVRRIAKDLLVRELLAGFPDGWVRNEDVHPITKIGGWSSEVGDYSRNQRYDNFAENILRSLASDNPPPEGWKPQYPDDPIIDRLFDVHWPAEQD